MIYYEIKSQRTIHVILFFKSHNYGYVMITFKIILAYVIISALYLKTFMSSFNKYKTFMSCHS